MNIEPKGIQPDIAIDAIIILPPGSTSAQLQAAINEAVSGDIIEISSDMTFTATVAIPAGKEITIQSKRWK